MRKIFIIFNLLISLFGFSQDGILDTSFDVGTGANENVYLMKQLPNGKILLGGQFTSYNGFPANGITRLNADGSFDSTFNTGTGINFRVHDALIENDGKIIIVGDFSSYNGVPRNCIVRIFEDGTIDSSFSIMPGGSIWDINSISKQNDKYIITGTFTTINNNNSKSIARLNYDGTSDLSFDSNGVSGSGNIGISKNIVLDDGKILIVGNFTFCQNVSRGRIARLNPNGTLDTTFNPGTGASSDIYSVAVQNDGKYIVGGKFSSYNGIGKPLIARINTDGTLDSSLSCESGFNSIPTSLLIQANGKIITGGGLSSMQGNDKYLTRLNLDGSFDSTFNTGTDFDNTINIMSLQTDGKILIGGWFSIYNNVPRERLLRLRNDSFLSNNSNLISSEFTLYPNPTNGKLYFDFKGFIISSLEIIISDISGKIIKKEIVTQENKKYLDLSIYDNGIYFLKFDDGNKSITKKIIKN